MKFHHTSIVGFLFVALLATALPLTVFILQKQQQTQQQAAGTTPYVFGTLETDPIHATAEKQAGLGAAMFTIGWDSAEPQDGVFNEGYIAQMKQELQTFQQVGMKVVLHFALHYPPAWVFTYPNSKYINQNGTTAGEVNIVFNQTLRQKAEQFITHTAQEIGIQKAWAVRINSGGDAEVLYPVENQNEYWAYDANAQNSINLPPTIPHNPFPGWKPGQTTYNGQQMTTAQVAQWYQWYVGALVDSVNWQIQVYKNLGYQGYFQILTPGSGTRPSDYQTAMNNYLNGTGDANQTM